MGGQTPGPGPTFGLTLGLEVEHIFKYWILFKNENTQWIPTVSTVVNDTVFMLMKKYFFLYNNHLFIQHWKLMWRLVNCRWQQRPSAQRSLGTPVSRRRSLHHSLRTPAFSVLITGCENCDITFYWGLDLKLHEDNRKAVWIWQQQSLDQSRQIQPESVDGIIPQVEARV